MRDMLVLITIAYVTLVVAFAWGEMTERNKYKVELKALQAQVDKKYCKGEVTYLQLKEELRK